MGASNHVLDICIYKEPTNQVARCFVCGLRILGFDGADGDGAESQLMTSHVWPNRIVDNWNRKAMGQCARRNRGVRFYTSRHEI